MLRTFPPFKWWKLPEGKEVEFRVTRSVTDMGAHTTYRHTKDSEHIVEVSERRTAYLLTMLRVLAHEMVHMAQVIAKSGTSGHNADFRRRGKTVCVVLGFDPKEF